MKKPQSKSFQFKYFKTIFALILLTILAVYVGFAFTNALRSGGDEINFSGIEVKTNTQADIYIDNSKVGKSNVAESFIYTKIQPGFKRLKIVKPDDSSLFYEKDVVFEKGTKVDIEWNFGVTNETSSGIIKYFVKKAGANNKIRIIPTQKDSIINVDSVINESGVIDSDGLQHNVEVSKQGYLSKTISLSLANKDTKTDQISQSDKDKYNDYDLVVEITLFQIPFL